MVILMALPLLLQICLMTTVHSPLLKGYIRRDELGLRTSLGLSIAATLAFWTIPLFPGQMKSVFLASALISTVASALTLYFEKLRRRAPAGH